MATTRTATQIINELREFASFTAQEQFFIERSLEVGRAQCGARGESQPEAQIEAEDDACANAVPLASTRSQQAAYRELLTFRGQFGGERPLEAIEGLIAKLVRVTAQDLARGALESFSAYRFLYERLLGATVRPYLPASFCAAAALPQIEPRRRKRLLETVSEAVVTTPGWSEREPVFSPCRVLDEPECGQ